MKILLTGGSGLLGKEIQKHLECTAPAHDEFDITRVANINDFEFYPEVIIHAAAYTDVAKAEHQKEECYRVNVLGTLNLLERYPKAVFVYISTEYANNPKNFYSQTKVQAEQLVRKFAPGYCIIRTLFKQTPWPYDRAFIDQWTEGDYVDIIAPMIVTAVIEKKRGDIKIGTDRKTMFQLARRTNPEVLGNLVSDIKGVELPHDYV